MTSSKTRAAVPSAIGRRTRGAAMLLVLIAVAMATILALSFLASQGPTAVVATNIDRKAKARAIAESALQMAIDYVNEDADWRTDKASGTWMSGASLDGGTFTLTGIDDDGDLTDDTADAVTLSVVATYNGVTHRVSARVTPGTSGASMNLLLVAGNGSSLSSQDQAKKTLFESWGYTVSVIDDNDSQSIYDAAVAVSNVVFVSEESSSGNVNTKLRDATIGVVNDEPYLQDDFGFSASPASNHTDVTAIDITDNSHPITTGFAIGSLTLVSTGTFDNWNTSGTIASGVTVLADLSGGDTNPVLMIADVGDTLHYGTAAGRRVMFPGNDDLDVANLNTDGQTLMRRCLEWATTDAAPSSDTPTLLALYEFEQVSVAPTLAGRWRLDETGASTNGAIQIGDKLTVNNGGYIDAYDSASGVYGGSNRYLDVDFITNSTGNNDININDGTIYGNAYVGSGGNPSSVVNIGSGSITGTEAAQTSNVSIPDYDEPDGFGSHSGHQTYDGGSHTWSSDQHFNNLTLDNNAQIYVSGDVAVRVSNQLKLNDGDIILNAGATLTLWVEDHINLDNGSTINNDTSRPGDLTLIQYGSGKDLNLNDGTIVGSVHIADDVTIGNGSAFYGNLIVDDDITIDDGTIHIDLATGPPAGSAAGPTTAADSSSLGNDGTVRGNPAGGVAGQHGTAFVFDGDDDYVEIAHDDSYLMQGGTFSVWFKADTTSESRQGLFSKDSTSYDTGGHFSVFLLYDYVEVRMQSTTSSYYVRSSSGSITAGQWYHIMFAWGEEGMVLYLDGVEVDTDTYTGGLGTTSGGVGNYEPIVLGGNTWQSDNLVATPVKDFFDGTLDDLRIYNERLSEAQAVEIYNGATEPSPFLSEVIVEDTSGYGDDLDLAIQDATAVAWASGGVTFTGDTLAVSLAEATKLHDAIEATGEFSVEVLLTRAAPNSTDSPSRAVSLADGASDHSFMLGQDDGHYEARVRDSSTGTNGALSPEFISSSDLNASGDTHVILSFKDGEVSVYIDGTLDETKTAGGTLNNWDDDHYLVFGGASNGSNYWNGTLKRVAIYDRGFNASQAQNVYNGSDPGDGATTTGTGSTVWDEVD